jgi:hypothetical protein
MLLSNVKKSVVALLAAGALALAATGAHAQGTDYRGTEIHVKNDTGRAMMFYLEFVTPTGQVRHFNEGLFLQPGQTGTFTTEPYYLVANRVEDGTVYHLIKVRGVTQDFQPIERFWGVVSSGGEVLDPEEIVGLTGPEWTSLMGSGFRDNMSVDLVW